jgi:hypothetical protein
LPDFGFVVSAYCIAGKTYKINGLVQPQTGRAQQIKTLQKSTESKELSAKQFPAFFIY